MKNKILFVLPAFTLAAGMLFASCNLQGLLGGDDDKKSSGGGDTISGNTITSGTPVSNPDGITETDFSSSGSNSSLSNVLDGESSVTISGGNVSIKLGTPKNEYLRDFRELSEMGINVNPPDAKSFSLYEFTSPDENYYLVLESGDHNNYASLIYADTNVTIKGTLPDPRGEFTSKFDITLKKGWNYLVESYNEATQTVTYRASTTLPAGFSWVVKESGKWEGPGGGSSGDFSYQINSGGTVTITRYYGNGGSVEIPSEIDGKTVTGIGEHAFQSCTSLTSATIPNTVTSIGNGAFYDCSKLTGVTIPNSVTSIGDYAFSSCTSLTSVTIPNSVTSIGDYTFINCTSLNSVTIGNSVTAIGNHAFNNCISLASITIPNNVTSIGDYAFSWCTSLTSVIIPDNVISVGEWVFNHCTGLTSITIGNSVTGIGNHAFSMCNSLISLTIGSGVTSIGEWAFWECTSLTSVTIPNKVTSIGERAFSVCINLTSVTFQGNIPSSGFNTSSFYFDLRDKYLAEGPGTYIKALSDDEWTKM